MTAKQFFDLVSRMRDAQKLYFKTRASTALHKSKAIESEVDAEIERANIIISERQEPKLF